MNRFACALLLATCLVPAARAADDPQTIAGANDTRIRVVNHSEYMVTRLRSTNLTPITITYGDGEIPKLMAGLKVVDLTPSSTQPQQADANKGQADTTETKCTEWCADRHNNEITLQPLKEDPGSLLVVTTEKKDPDSGTVIRHHYAYELGTRVGQITDGAKDAKGTPIPVDPEAYFRVINRYPAEEAAKKAAAWRAAHKDDQAAAQREKIQDRLTLAQFGGPDRNYQWTWGDSAACQELIPRPTSRISDNGQFTTLYLPMNTPVSVPNQVADDGSESRLEWHADKAPDSGNLVVLHTVPKRFVVRRDKLVCLAVRNPKAPWQPVPDTGTSSPDVVRETRK